MEGLGSREEAARVGRLVMVKGGVGHGRGGGWCASRRLFGANAAFWFGIAPCRASGTYTIAPPSSELSSRHMFACCNHQANRHEWKKYVDAFTDVFPMSLICKA